MKIVTTTPNVIASFVLCLLGALPVMAQAEIAQWTPITHTELDYLYVRKGIDLSEFDSIMIDPLSVWHAGPEGSTDSLELEKLRNKYAERFRSSFHASGFRVVTSPTDTTLRLHAELIDLKVIQPSNPAPQLGKRFRFDIKTGKMTLVAEVRDATTGTVLLRVADLEGHTSAAGSLWGEVELAMRDWSTTLGATIKTLRTNDAAQIRIAGLGKR